MYKVNNTSDGVFWSMIGMCARQEVENYSNSL